MSVRALSAADLRKLAELMLEAYRNTIDYEGEGVAEAIAEVEGYFSHEAENPAIAHHSVALASGDAIACACMIKLWRRRGVPLVGYVMCHPDRKHRGLATLALHEAIGNLQRAGFGEVRAIITEGNAPSEALFARAGFQRVAR
jgi:RimJ/RimL family protein N-acetyltransferase